MQYQDLVAWIEIILDIGIGIAIKRPSGKTLTRSYMIEDNAKNLGLARNGREAADISR